MNRYEMVVIKNVVLPPVRFELTTPGLQDQCSTTELYRHDFSAEITYNQ